MSKTQCWLRTGPLFFWYPSDNTPGVVREKRRRIREWETMTPVMRTAWRNRYTRREIALHRRINSRSETVPDHAHAGIAAGGGLLARIGR